MPEYKPSHFLINMFALYLINQLYRYEYIHLDHQNLHPWGTQSQFTFVFDE